MIKKEIFYIGAEFGAGAGTIGCEKAPCVISDNIQQVKNTSNSKSLREVVINKQRAEKKKELDDLVKDLIDSDN